MENQSRRRLLAAVALVLGIGAIPLAALAAGGASGSGNGGAGIYQNGRYMTFFSAGLYTDPTPAMDESDIPGMKELITFWDQFPYVSDQSKVDLINSVRPSDQHEYYKVREDRFDEATRQRLIAEFERVTKQPTNQLELFAITDTFNKKTYLLPNFYRLNTEEQMTILFHENYWLLNPRSGYATVVAAEMAFQALLAEPQNMKRLQAFLQFYGTRGDQLKAVIQMDLKSGALGGLLTEKGIQLSELLGEETLDCSEKGGGGSCYQALKLHLFRLSVQYPRSFFLKYMNQRSTILDRKAVMSSESRRCLFYGDDSRSCGNGMIVRDLYLPTWGFKHHCSYAPFCFGKVHRSTPLDYTECFVDLNLSSLPQPSNQVLFIPVQCKDGGVRLFDTWLSSSKIDKDE